MKKVIMVRSRVLINTDSQRRCYNGCHFSSRLSWTEWEPLEYLTNNVEERLKFWRELNDYAVSFRGEIARREFKEENV